MEIKLKTAEGLVDPIIEIVDGVMVVSPKEEKFEPKDGDVIFSGTSLISIFKKMTSDTSLSAYIALSKGELHAEFDSWSTLNIRLATEEEKQKLFDKLKEEGYEFDFENKELVKLRWKPKFGEDYYTPSWNEYVFEPYLYGWAEDEFDCKCHTMGRVFKTKEECQAFCDNLNEAINSVKP